MLGILGDNRFITLVLAFKDPASNLGGLRKWISPQLRFCLLEVPNDSIMGKLVDSGAIFLGSNLTCSSTSCVILSKLPELSMPVSSLVNVR